MTHLLIALCGFAAGLVVGAFFAVAVICVNFVRFLLFVETND